MPVQIKAEVLTAPRFAPFGDVLDFAGKPDKIINQGMCGRFHDRAKVTHIDGQSGISLFDSVPRQLPYRLEMMEPVYLVIKSSIGKSPSCRQPETNYHLAPFLFFI